MLVSCTRGVWGVKADLAKGKRQNKPAAGWGLVFNRISVLVWLMVRLRNHYRQHKACSRTAWWGRRCNYFSWK